jgi:aryl sulfotransferase
MGATPRIEHRYEHFIFDSQRWSGFTPRDGDVVVCTGYKAGTTWTQMICAMLIHRTAHLPAPLALLSPWIDMRTTAIAEVLATLDAQEHRRVMKTHTALDGLPYFDNVTYLFCGRDPRDVFVSFQNHMANSNPVRAAELLMAQGVELPPQPVLPENVDDRFALWLTQGSFEWEQDGAPFWSHMRHAQTFWEHRHASNIHFLHYADLKADLEGQMRRVAGILGLQVDETLWPSLIEAAGFEEMRARADIIAPDAHQGMWLDNSRFFHKGETGQWREVLSEESARRYQEVTRGRYQPLMMEWLERGSGAVGDPKAL